MSEDRKVRLERVYGAKSAEDLAESYDDWAAHYDQDLLSYGYRLPAIAAGLLGRYAPPGSGPVLDAGCGTGLIGEVLSLLGYGGLTGIDLSEGMLAAARAKAAYSELAQMRLGGPLALPNDHFAATVAIGVLTVGHAGPGAFDELIRVTRPGAPLVFSIRVDGGAGSGFLERMAALARDGTWVEVARTPEFQSIPRAEPEVHNRVFVTRKT